MSDLTTPVSVACPSQHEPPPLSLISSNHNNSISSIVEDDSIRMSSASHPKSVSVGGDSPLCNGSHVDEDTLENHQHNKAKGESERHTLEQQKCVEKVNGLIHSEYNSEDNRLLVNLLNTCCKEDAESHSGDSGRSSGVACQCTEGECEEKSCNELKHNAEKSSPKVHCDVKHNDVDKLLSELEKASLDQHSSSSDHLTSDDVINGVTYVVYESEKQMPDIMRLITKDLSEPYSIYTYRYFIHNWPKLCFLAMVDKKCVGAIVCKLDLHKKMVRRGYIAMLAVDSEYRRRQIGSTLVTKAIEAMIRDDCDEVVLETEITNQGALRLYENLGFVRDKRLFRYYLNGVDALRLKLWLR